MSTATLPTWSVIAADATRYRERIGEQVRTWGAMHHATTCGAPVPSRWLAAIDSTSRPPRTRLLAVDLQATDRDRAEAAADDLWDAVAVAWCFVRWLQTERPTRDPGAEHVIAELYSAGRWLANYPVNVSAHDAAIDRLFLADGGATP
jgi:hypothetical protein